MSATLKFRRYFGEATTGRRLRLTNEEGAQFMPKIKTLVRKPWTKEDMRTLKAHSKARTPVAKVAKAMKRTEGAVRQKA
jgi:hypothetical protein